MTQTAHLHQNLYVKWLFGRITSEEWHDIWGHNNKYKKRLYIYIYIDLKIYMYITRECWSCYLHLDSIRSIHVKVPTEFASIWQACKPSGNQWIRRYSRCHSWRTCFCLITLLGQHERSDLWTVRQNEHNLRSLCYGCRLKVMFHQTKGHSGFSFKALGMP